MTEKISITLTPEIFDFNQKLVKGEQNRIFIRNPKDSDTKEIHKVLLGRCIEKKTYVQCGRKLLKDSIGYIHAGLVNAIHELNLDGVFTYTRDRIQHPNGSQIVFSGIRKHGIFDRISADIFYGENAHDFPQITFDDLGPTILMVPSVMIFTGNTMKKNNPFWKYSEIYRENFSAKTHIIDFT